MNVGATNNGETNPGLMQSAQGTSFVGSSASAEDQKQSIIQMITDGVQGTSKGDGLVQGINKYGDIYEVKRQLILTYSTLQRLIESITRLRDIITLDR